MISEKLKGKKVVYIDETNHKHYPKNCPEPGTIGTIVQIHPKNNEVEIQWPKGSTSEEDCWWHDDFEFVVIKNPGHWIPVGPFTMPNNGEIVRYAREIDKDMDNKFAEDFYMSIGDEYIVQYWGKSFGVIREEKDENWIDSSDYPSRFDRWVEE